MRAERVWSRETLRELVVRDANGRALACVYIGSRNERGGQHEFIAERRQGSVGRQNLRAGRLCLDRLAEARGSYPLNGSIRRR